MTPESLIGAFSLIDRFDQMLQHLRALDAGKAKARHRRKPAAPAVEALPGQQGQATEKAADAWHLMLAHLRGEPPTPLEPARPVNGLRRRLFTPQAGVEAEKPTTWRIVAGKAVKVTAAPPKASNGAGLSG